MIHEIERLRGPPGHIGWFYEQTREDQVELMAWYRIFLDPSNEAAKQRTQPKPQPRSQERRPARAEARARAGK